MSAVSSAAAAPPAPPACWVCGAGRFTFAKTSGLVDLPDARDFAITDSRYGVTGTLWRCDACGFIQCSDLADVLSYYESLEDPDYEAGRRERGLQADKLIDLLERVAPRQAGARWLDVGAGSGILVEAAGRRGYRAVGVEPSGWLAATAQKLGLPVVRGTLPDPAVPRDAQVVTVVDVIEHVPDPVGLLAEVGRHLADGGVGLVVTPDVGSLAARALGHRWWHYRIAHIGYFNRDNLLRALRRAGLEPIRVGRPAWYFQASYLLARLGRYLPGVDRLSKWRWLDRITVPLNLGDSLYVVFRKSGVG